MMWDGTSPSKAVRPWDTTARTARRPRRLPRPRPTWQTLEYSRDALGRLTGRPRMDVEAAWEDFIVDMIRHCEQVLRDWLQEVVDNGETRPLDFDALVTRAIATLPRSSNPWRRTTAPYSGRCSSEMYAD